MVGIEAQILNQCGNLQQKSARAYRKEMLEKLHARVRTGLPDLPFIIGIIPMEHLIRFLVVCHNHHDLVNSPHVGAIPAANVAQFVLLKRGGPIFLCPGRI